METIPQFVTGAGWLESDCQWLAAAGFTLKQEWLVLGMGYHHISHIVCHRNNIVIIAILMYIVNLSKSYNSMTSLCPTSLSDKHSKLFLWWLWTIWYQKQSNASNILSVLVICFSWVEILSYFWKNKEEFICYYFRLSLASLLGLWYHGSMPEISHIAISKLILRCITMCNISPSLRPVYKQLRKLNSFNLPGIAILSGVNIDVLASHFWSW